MIIDIRHETHDGSKKTLQMVAESCSGNKCIASASNLSITSAVARHFVGADYSCTQPFVRSSMHLFTSDVFFLFPSFWIRRLDTSHKTSKISPISLVATTRCRTRCRCVGAMNHECGILFGAGTYLHGRHGKWKRPRPFRRDPVEQKKAHLLREKERGFY